MIIIILYKWDYIIIFILEEKDADITEWLEYFISTMANTFEAVGNRVKKKYI